MDSAETARAYYRSLDEHAYDRLADLFAPSVVHDRPDRTIEGRDELVGFMRDDRPNKETAHAVGTIFATEHADELAVRGTLLDASDDPLFEFVDVFTFDDGKIAEIKTFSR